MVVVMWAASSSKDLSVILEEVGYTGREFW